jgi:hypothetical protein
MPDHVIVKKSKIRMQENTQWCYAAVAQIVIEHYDKKLVPQSEIVNSVAGSPTDNEPQDPYTHLHELHHIYSIVKDVAPDPAVIRDQIDQGRPIIVRVGNAGSGHYMIIVGYSDNTPRASSARGDASVSGVWYIDPLSETYTIERGSNAHSRVECAYEDSVTKETKRGKDSITGYYLTAPKDVCEPRDIKADEKEATKTKRAQDKKTAAAAAAAAAAPAAAAPADVTTSTATASAVHVSPKSPSNSKKGKSKKSKKGGRRARMRNPTRKCQKRRRTRTTIRR